jgi:hypothetical protein
VLAKYTALVMSHALLIPRRSCRAGGHACCSIAPCTQHIRRASFKLSLDKAVPVLLHCQWMQTLGAHQYPLRQSHPTAVLLPLSAEKKHRKHSGC